MGEEKPNYLFTERIINEKKTKVVILGRRKFVMSVWLSPNHMLWPWIYKLCCQFWRFKGMAWWCLVVEMLNAHSVTCFFLFINYSSPFLEIIMNLWACSKYGNGICRVQMDLVDFICWLYIVTLNDKCCYFSHSNLWKRSRSFSHLFIDSVFFRVG